jgi:hypothetical protein
MAVGTRFVVAAGNRHGAAFAAQATSKAATGIACPRLVATALDCCGGSRGFFLGRKLQVVHQAKDLAVFGLMPL